MDGRARVEAALALEVADRPPLGLWGHSYQEEWRPADLAAVTLANRHRFGWDFVKLQPRASCFAEAYGAVYRPSGNRLEGPVMTKAAIERPDELAGIGSLDSSSPPLADQVDALSRVASSLGDAVSVLQTVFSPATVAGWLVGENPPRIIDELRDRPHLILRAMNRIADTLIDFATASVDAGAAGLFFAVTAYASARVMSEADYRDLLLPYDLKVLSSLPPAAWFNVVHLCGERIHFGLAAEFPCEAVSWSINAEGNPSLAQAISTCGRAAMGGLDQGRTLVTGPPEAAAAEARAAMLSREGRGVMVAPGCSVPPEAPEEVLEAVADAVREPGPG